MLITNTQKEQFEVRDLRSKEKFIMDDSFLNGYARFLGIYAVGVYVSLCRHANKVQRCWPSIRKLQEELNISKNSVLRALKALHFWNIIKRMRIGKTVNNRYDLIDKKHWKQISEVHIRDFSEVCERDFTGLSQALHLFTTGTSNKGNTSKETQVRKKNSSNNNPKKNSNSSYKKKPYYDGRPMRQVDGKWWVIPKGGGHPWLEYTDKESAIEWR